MQQMELDLRTKAEEITEGSVQGVVRALVQVCDEEYRIRSTHEAFGILAEAEMKLVSAQKEMKKAMAKLLETLEDGYDTPVTIAAVEHLAEETAEEALMMAAKARTCIDYLTYQERIMKNMDPETGEIKEDGK